MPAIHTLHVSVTKPLLEYVRQQVAEGHYATASEVVRAALERHACDAPVADQIAEGMSVTRG